MSEAHHESGPSVQGRRKLCPGSLYEERRAKALGIVEVHSDAAEEGHAFHRALNPAYSLDEFSEEDRELIERARAYVERVMAGAISVEYEVRVELRDASGALVTFGTIDVKGVFTGVEDCFFVKIFDAKFGRLDPDPVFLLEQLRCYAGGAMQQHGFSFALGYAYHPRSDTEFTEEFRHPYVIADEVARTIAYAEEHPDELHPSESACRYCLAKPICPALKAEVTTAIEKAMPTAVASPEDVKAMMDMASKAEKWAEAVKDYVKSLPEEQLMAAGYVFAERQMPRLCASGERYTQRYLRKLKEA